MVELGNGGGKVRGVVGMGRGWCRGGVEGGMGREGSGGRPVTLFEEVLVYRIFGKFYYGIRSSGE